jgi:light-regulated signal transduction histidine kinase (bacteriophytochrome)
MAVFSVTTPGLCTLRDANRRRQAAQNALCRAGEVLEKRLAERAGETAGQKAALEERIRDLERSNTDLAQFAYAASHDLQEPLRAMTGCVQLFERKYRGKIDKGSDELIGMVVAASARMKALIEGLLAYSRVGQDEKLEAVDTGGVLQQVLANLSLALSESRAEVSFESLPSLVFAKGEFDRLIQNLIGNAIKYRGKATPKIQVNAERQLGAWIFRIVDNGMGFEPKYADKIFGIFERLHTSEEHLGAGIGLASAKKIVERRGGWIWVDSVPGEGSTFFFSVPDEYANRRVLPE